MSFRKTDSFGTFLRSVRGCEVGEETSRSVVESTRSFDAAPTGAQLLPATLDLLSAVARSSPQPPTVPRLMEESKLDIRAFTQALAAVHETGLVAIEGAGADQAVRLTERGRTRLESLAPPADPADLAQG